MQMQYVWSDRSAGKMAGIVGIMSVLDLALTLTGLRMGIITEGNPMMNAVLQASPESFVLLKTFLTLLFVAVISRHAGRYEWAKPAVMSVFCVYSGVMILHVRWICTAVGIC